MSAREDSNSFFIGFGCLIYAIYLVVLATGIGIAVHFIRKWW